MQVISSVRNPVIQGFLNLLKGKAPAGDNRLILEGMHLIDDCIGAGLYIETFFYAPELLPAPWLKRILGTLSAQTRVVPVTPTLIRKISLTETPQGAVGVAIYPDPDLEHIMGQANLFALIADRIQDPGNLGTIIRTAGAAGMHAVICTPGTVNHLNPKVVRSTAGALFHIGVIPVKDPQQLAVRLKKRGVQIIAAHPGAHQSYTEASFIEPTALIIGNESWGVSAGLLKEADRLVKIPLKEGIESLNASAAAAVIIYEAYRQRNLMNPL